MKKGSKMSAEYRARRSAAMKELWSDPEAKSKRSAAIKKGHSTPEFKAKMSSDEYRARRSTAMKKVWSDPEAKARRIAAIKKTYSTPEVKAKRSTIMKNIYSTPEAKAGQSVRMKKVWSDPENKAKFSELRTGRVKSEEEIELILSHRNQKIICLDTGVIYKNQAEVARTFNVHSSTIANSINEKRPCMAGSFARLVEYMEEQNAKRAS